MTIERNLIHLGDSLEILPRITAGSVDLVFADPPFNIGYEYDVYEDQRDSSDYLQWCQRWMREIHRVLKPNGSFWLAIGDEFAAELKLVAQREIGFHCRSWVIWYYTFGVNCARGFSRSHTHLFHFVCDPKSFTFNHDNPAVRVPSARQLVYADHRANPRGRLPDNTWIYRPQDGPLGSFSPSHDTWYFARVAGTFKEREGFHGCQMPEQLMGRIIRVSSQPRDIVLDPFAGSGTTLSVAKKLGRQWIGIELSSEYVERIQDRLQHTAVGDELDGAADPIRSAPTTISRKSRARGGRGGGLSILGETSEQQLIDAFRQVSRGHSLAVMLCDPELNAEFIERCRAEKIVGTPFLWNRTLIKLRRARKLARAERLLPLRTFEMMDPYSHASEISLQAFSVEYRLSLEDLLCEPQFAREFDRVAADFAPGFTPFEYRWGAMAIRRRARWARQKAWDQFRRWAHCELPPSLELEKLRSHPTAQGSGVYLLLRANQSVVYVGEAIDVHARLEQMDVTGVWQQLGVTHGICLPMEVGATHGLQSMLIHRTDADLNWKGLHPEPRVVDEITSDNDCEDFPLFALAERSNGNN